MITEISQLFMETHTAFANHLHVSLSDPQLCHTFKNLVTFALSMTEVAWHLAGTVCSSVYFLLLSYLSFT